MRETNGISVRTFSKMNDTLSDRGLIDLSDLNYSYYSTQNDVVKQLNVDLSTTMKSSFVSIINLARLQLLFQFKSKISIKLLILLPNKLKKFKKLKNLATKQTR
jgi:hypothetical protein